MTTNANNKHVKDAVDNGEEDPLVALESFASGKDGSNLSDNDDEHLPLFRRPYLWAAVGVAQTFATAIMFGWASLVPILRAEGINYTPQALSFVFTCGAVGNYLATLPFGIMLDGWGPKKTGIVASLLYAIGLILCSFNANFVCFAVGFGLIGLSRPGIQMPTLHLANLFNQSGGGGGALYMSAQAAAFDAGTAVFAVFHTIYFEYGVPSSTMFLAYLVVPAWTLATAIWVWPNRTIHGHHTKAVPASPHSTGRSQNDLDDEASVGSAMSPYLSPRDRSSFRAVMEKKKNRIESSARKKRSQINAPLSVVLTHVAFYALSSWVAVHIYKLNFVVATINDQLKRHFDEETAGELIDILGCMLPFGFVVLPIVATMLHTRPMMALQVANVVGFIYGGVMVYFPQVYWLQILVVFPAVATSRQLVYSTLFHTIGQVFGFANYGALLGLTNAIASTLQMLQTPMVDWSENENSYFGSNFVLWAVVVPLFVTVLYSDPTWDPSMWFIKKDKSGERGRKNKARNPEMEHSSDDQAADEATSLLHSFR